MSGRSVSAAPSATSSARSPLRVYFTTDVEVWCDGWKDIDAKFATAFQQYIYGATHRGTFGLPYQLSVLADHGLKATFFVESLFSARFGSQPLEEIVQLIKNTGQEVQLHLHTEWVDEAKIPLLPNCVGKRQYLFQFSLEEQQLLVAAAATLLMRAGVDNVDAFRAGGFGFNLNTLRALARNGIPFDSSYNATLFGPQSGVAPECTLVEPTQCEGVTEFPMTVFHDGRGLRHAQITACSYSEMEGLLWRALEHGRSTFVILSHNFELLNESRTRPDDIAVRRFLRLCAFLDRHRDEFQTCHFRGWAATRTPGDSTQLSSPLWRTGARLLEQAYRWRYQ